MCPQNSPLARLAVQIGALILGRGTLLDFALRRLRLRLVVTACHGPDYGQWRQCRRTGLGGDVPPPMGTRLVKPFIG